MEQIQIYHIRSLRKYRGSPKSVFDILYRKSQTGSFVHSDPSPPQSNKPFFKYIKTDEE